MYMENDGKVHEQSFFLTSQTFHPIPIFGSGFRETSKYGQNHGHTILYYFFTYRQLLTSCCPNLLYNRHHGVIYSHINFV